MLDFSGIRPSVVEAPTTLKKLMKEGTKLGYSNIINASEKRLRYSFGRAIFYEYLDLANYNIDELRLPFIVSRTKQYIDDFSLESVEWKNYRML